MRWFFAIRNSKRSLNFRDWLFNKLSVKRHHASYKNMIRPLYNVNTASFYQKTLSLYFSKNIWLTSKQDSFAIYKKDSDFFAESQIMDIITKIKTHWKFYYKVITVSFVRDCLNLQKDFKFKFSNDFFAGGNWFKYWFWPKLFLTRRFFYRPLYREDGLVSSFLGKFIKNFFFNKYLSYFSKLRLFNNFNFSTYYFTAVSDFMFNTDDNRSLDYFKKGFAFKNNNNLYNDLKFLKGDAFWLDPDVDIIRQDFLKWTKKYKFCRQRRSWRKYSKIVSSWKWIDKLSLKGIFVKNKKKNRRSFFWKKRWIKLFSWKWFFFYKYFKILPRNKRKYLLDIRKLSLNQFVYWKDKFFRYNKKPLIIFKNNKYYDKIKQLKLKKKKNSLNVSMFVLDARLVNKDIKGHKSFLNKSFLNSTFECQYSNIICKQLFTYYFFNINKETFSFLNNSLVKIKIWFLFFNVNFLESNILDYLNLLFVKFLTFGYKFSNLTNFVNIALFAHFHPIFRNLKLYNLVLSLYLSNFIFISLCLINFKISSYDKYYKLISKLSSVEINLNEKYAKLDYDVNLVRNLRFIVLLFKYRNLNNFWFFNKKQVNNCFDNFSYNSIDNKNYFSYFYYLYNKNKLNKGRDFLWY